MNSKRMPWYKRYPTDWLGNPAYQACSLSARGLATCMMDLMHQGDPYGHLCIKGRPIDDPTLAKLCGAPEALVTVLLSELVANGVFEPGSSGALCSPQLIKERERSIEAAKNGRRGGNPAFKKRPIAASCPRGRNGGHVVG